MTPRKKRAEEYCAHCNCVWKKPPCEKCREGLGKMKPCKGTCVCCVEYRKSRAIPTEQAAVNAAASALVGRLGTLNISEQASVSTQPSRSFCEGGVEPSSAIPGSANININLPSTSTAQQDIPTVPSSELQHKCQGSGACNCLEDKENESSQSPSHVLAPSAGFKCSLCQRNMLAGICFRCIDNEEDRFNWVFENPPSSRASFLDTNEGVKCCLCQRIIATGICFNCLEIEYDPPDWTSQSLAKRARTSTEGDTSSATAREMPSSDYVTEKEVTTPFKLRRKRGFPFELPAKYRRLDEPSTSAAPSIIGVGTAPISSGSMQRLPFGGCSFESPVVRPASIIRNMVPARPPTTGVTNVPRGISFAESSDARPTSIIRTTVPVRPSIPDVSNIQRSAQPQTRLFRLIAPARRSEGHKRDAEEMDQE